MANYSDHFIFVSGGHDPPSYEGASSAVEYYSIKNDTWLAAPYLIQARYLHSSCVLSGKIYVFGGSFAGRGRKIETFNSIEWLEVASVLY